MNSGIIVERSSRLDRRGATEHVLRVVRNHDCLVEAIVKPEGLYHLPNMSRKLGIRSGVLVRRNGEKDQAVLLRLLRHLELGHLCRKVKARFP